MPHAWFVCLLAIALALSGATPLQARDTGMARSIAVLAPVDVAFQIPRPLAADFLRKGIDRSGYWNSLHPDTVGRRMREAGLDPDRPCKEFQCAFDAGSALQVEYVLFGTLASLKELQAYTVTLVHVPTSQVVWSRAGDLPRKDGERPQDALENALAFAAESVDPGALDLRKVPGLGLMAVVDAGDASSHARVVRERAMAHVYASRNYDLIAQEELEDLLRALDIPPPAEGTPEQEIIDIGRRMDVRYVLTSRLARSRDSWKLQLSLYDLQEQKEVRRWPSRGHDDFAKLLRIEDRFFTTLSDPDLPAGPAIPRPSPVRIAGKYASVLVALASSTTLGYLAWTSKQDADQEYRRFQAAHDPGLAAASRKRVLEGDVQTKRYALLSGVCFVLGVAVWSF